MCIRDRQYDVLKTDLNKVNADYENLNRQKAKLEEELAVVGSSLQESLGKISDLEVEVEHRVTTEKHLRLHEVQLQTSLNEILSSRSWKFTSPFRKARTLSKTVLKVLSFHNTKTHAQKTGVEKTNNIISKNKSRE